MDSGNQEDNGIGTAELYSSLNRLNPPQGTSTKEKAAGGDYSELKQVNSLFFLSVCVTSSYYVFTYESMQN